MWVPVTTAWCVLRLRMEERLPIWRVAANELNKQSRTADEVWSSSLEVGRGANNASLWKSMLRNTHKSRLALVGTVRNLRVPKMRGISCLAAEPVSFSRRTLLHGVSKWVHEDQYTFMIISRLILLTIRNVKVKVNQSRYRPGVAHRVPQS